MGEGAHFAQRCEDHKGKIKKYCGFKGAQTLGVGWGSAPAE